MNAGIPQPATLVRLRPRGPWRFGPGDGTADRVDQLYRSDRLFSAVTHAMHTLGELDAWLEATARASTAAVAFTSLFPFQGDTLFTIPPGTLWPPPPASLTASSPVFLSKIRWQAARFVPTTAIETILLGQKLLADQWVPDPESECLLRRDRPSASPFRLAVRSGAAVDRLTSAVAVHAHACVEFESGAGLWTVVRFAHAAAESRWSQPVESAFRLLADTGFGGRRSVGWGQTDAPEFQRGSWPSLLFPKLARAPRNNGAGSAFNNDSKLYWLLSLYSPAASDAIQWSAGDYRLTIRGGRVQTPALGSGTEKKRVRMVVEGSVLAARAEPVGVSVDVAPDGFSHPVYRSGIALALELPTIEFPSEQGPVEEPAPEALEPEPIIPETEPEPVEPEQPAEPAEPAMESSLEQPEAPEAPPEPTVNDAPESETTEKEKEEPGYEI
jgi:CRISPR type III-A-associated RAMP protein Csm4